MPSPPLSSEPVDLVVEATAAGQRLDAFLARHFPDYSRGLLRRAIGAGGATVDGRGTKPAYRLLAGQRVTIFLPEIPRQTPRPENIPIEILYEDEHVAVVNKPPGMVVHPARGHWSGTLAGALQFHFGCRLSTLGGLTRPGIVHRLDRDTSGAILVALQRPGPRQALGPVPRAHDREGVFRPGFRRARVGPRLTSTARSACIRVQREKMAIRREEAHSRPAQTYYEVLERFDGFSAVKAMPKTGRTHQIRVHLGHLGCPVLCDRQYGGRSQITRGELRRDPADTLVLLARQALHAWRLRFVHPVGRQTLEIEAPLPADMLAVLDALRTFRAL